MSCSACSRLARVSAVWPATSSTVSAIADDARASSSVVADACVTAALCWVVVAANSSDDADNSDAAEFTSTPATPGRVGEGAELAGLAAGEDPRRQRRHERRRAATSWMARMRWSWTGARLWLVCSWASTIQPRSSTTRRPTDDVVAVGVGVLGGPDRRSPPARVAVVVDRRSADHRPRAPPRRRRPRPSRCRRSTRRSESTTITLVSVATRGSASRQDRRVQIADHGTLQTRRHRPRSARRSPSRCDHHLSRRSQYRFARRQAVEPISLGRVDRLRLAAREHGATQIDHFDQLEVVVGQFDAGHERRHHAGSIGFRWLGRRAPPGCHDARTTSPRPATSSAWAKPSLFACERRSEARRRPRGQQHRRHHHDRQGDGQHPCDQAEAIPKPSPACPLRSGAGRRSMHRDAVSRRRQMGKRQTHE